MAPLLAASAATSVLLVTSARHMRRAHLVAQVLHEVIGLAYYRAALDLRLQRAQGV